MAFDVNSMTSNTSFDAALNRMAERVAGFEEDQARVSAEAHAAPANAALAGGMLTKLDWGNPLALMQELEKQYSQLAQLANSAKRFSPEPILTWADKVPMPQFSMGDAGTAQAPMAPVANAGPQIKATTKIPAKPDAPKPGADEGKKTEEAGKKDAEGVEKPKEPLAAADIDELKTILADSKYDPSTQEFLLGKIKDKFKDDKVKAKEVAQSLPPASDDSAAWGNAFGVWLGQNFHELSEEQAKFATGRLAFTEGKDADFVGLKSPTVEFDREEKAQYVYEVSGQMGTKGSTFADDDKVFKRGDQWFKVKAGKETEITEVEKFDHGLLYFNEGTPILNFLAPQPYFEGFETGDGKAVLEVAKAKKSVDDLLGEAWVKEAASNKILTPSVQGKLKFEYHQAEGDKKARIDIRFEKTDKDAIFKWLDDGVTVDVSTQGSDSLLSDLARNLQDKDIEVRLNGKRKVDGFTTNATKALRDLVKDEEGEDAPAAPVGSQPIEAPAVGAANVQLQKAGNEVVDVSNPEGKIAKWKSDFAGLEESFANAGSVQDAAENINFMAGILVGFKRNKLEDVQAYEDKLKTHVAEFQNKYPSNAGELRTALDVSGDGNLAVALEAEKPAVPVTTVTTTPIVATPAPAVAAAEPAPVADDMSFLPTDYQNFAPSAADKKLKAEFDVLAGRYKRSAKAYDLLLTTATEQGKTKAFVNEQVAKKDYDTAVADFQRDYARYQHVEGYNDLYNQFTADQEAFKQRYVAVTDMDFAPADVTKSSFNDLKEKFDAVAKKYDDLLTSLSNGGRDKSFAEVVRREFNAVCLEVLDARKSTFKDYTPYSDFIKQVTAKQDELSAKYNRLPKSVSVGTLSPDDLAKKLHGSFS